MRYSRKGCLSVVGAGLEAVIEAALEAAIVARARRHMANTATAHNSHYGDSRQK